MTHVLNWKISTAGAVAGILVAMLLVPSGAEAHHLADAGVALPDLVEVSSGWMHTCGRSANGEVYCWGNNATGNLGDGTAATVRPLAKRVTGFDAPVVQVSSGADHTCALTELQDVWCWGGNLSGQLGGVPADLGLIRRTPGKVDDFWTGDLPKFTQISAGNTHTCALDTTGVPWCWGSDSNGQLGRRDPFWGPAGGGPEPVWADVSGMGKVSRIVAGASHTCALNLEGELWCWGSNSDGRVGDGTTKDRTLPVRVAESNGFPDGGVTDFALGTYHTCATTVNGHVYCWGDNGYGRLGNPTASSSKVPVQVRKYVDISTTAEFAGLSNVTTGLDHTCAWSPEGTGWCWGRSLYGQLGDGIVASTQPLPRYAIKNRTVLMEPTGAVLQVSAGYNHTCAVHESGQGHCWGHNGLGQNGDGTFAFHKEPARVFQLGAPDVPEEG